MDGVGDDDDVEDQGGCHGPKKAGDEDVPIHKICISTVKSSKLTRDSSTFPDKVFVKNFDNPRYEHVKLSITKTLKWMLNGQEDGYHFISL